MKKIILIYILGILLVPNSSKAVVTIDEIIPPMTILDIYPELEITGPTAENLVKSVRDHTIFYELWEGENFYSSHRLAPIGNRLNFRHNHRHRHENQIPEPTTVVFLIIGIALSFVARKFRIY